MPMPAKGIRLAMRRRKGREPVYVIRDGAIERSTGTGRREEAEIELARYIEQKNRREGFRGPDQTTVAEVLAIYAEEHAPTLASPRSQGLAIAALLPFWGALRLSEVTGERCRQYGRQRRNVRTGEPCRPGTVRRELNTLAAAINYCHREGYITAAPRVSLPKTPETRQRALSRGEVAQLLRACRRRGVPHLSRFILVSIYTGTRTSAALNLRLEGPSVGSGWFDLRAGVLYRIGSGETATRKRRTPARIPRQLLAHAKRWRAGGSRWAVEWNGARVASIKTAWASVLEEAGLSWRPTPHTLKHTAITWAIEAGASIADAAAYFGTSVATIERVYWHRSPHFQEGAVRAIEDGKRL